MSVQIRVTEAFARDVSAIGMGIIIGGLLTLAALRFTGILQVAA